MEFTSSVHSAVYTGKVIKDGLNIEKYFVKSANDKDIVPFHLVYKGKKENQPVILFLSPGGKEDLYKSSEVAQLTEKGYAIVSPDLPGTGELYDAAYRGVTIKGVLYNYLLGTNLVGRSIPGIQAESINLLWQHLQMRDDIQKGNISAVISGEMCSSFLHFAVFDKSFKQILFLNPYLSYLDLASTRYYHPRLMLSSVPGALIYYDLPDMESLLAPVPLTIMNPVYADLNRLKKEDVDKEYNKVRAAYSGPAGDKLKILITADENVAEELKKIF
jgi:hypothetical protein